MNTDLTCSVMGCGREDIRAKGWCGLHYSRWFNHGDVLWVPPLFVPTTCSVAGCTERGEKRGWCNKHYRRWMANGDPAELKRTPNGEPRAFFEENVMARVDGCKAWPYSHDQHGYGKLWYDGRMRPVHMIACARWHGPRPSPKHHAAHGECHDPGCWSGEHVSWKTATENAGDKQRDGTHRFGVDINCAKLSDQVVLTVRDRLRAGEGRTSLAAEYGVTYMTIALIDRGKTWKHLLP